MSVLCWREQAQITGTPQLEDAEIFRQIMFDVIDKFRVEATIIIAVPNIDNIMKIFEMAIW